MFFMALLALFVDSGKAIEYSPTSLRSEPTCEARAAGLLFHGYTPNVTCVATSKAWSHLTCETSDVTVKQFGLHHVHGAQAAQQERILDPDFDLDEFRAALEGQKELKSGIAMPPNIVANLFSGRISGGELTEKLVEQFGASKSAAYRAIKDATNDKYLEICGRGRRGKLYRKGYKATDISID